VSVINTHVAELQGMATTKVCTAIASCFFEVLAVMAACHPRRLSFFFETSHKPAARRQKIIRWRVLSEHVESVFVAAKTTAAHRAVSCFLPLATTFGPGAAVGTQPPDRAC
jgi:hypothetical protein